MTDSSPSILFQFIAKHLDPALQFAQICHYAGQGYYWSAVWSTDRPPLFPHSFRASLVGLPLRLRDRNAASGGTNLRYGDKQDAKLRLPRPRSRPCAMEKQVLGNLSMLERHEKPLPQPEAG